MPPESASDIDSEDDDDILLPPAPVRRWLLDELANLISVRGYTPIAIGPILQPNENFFPDPFAADRSSVRRLLRRLAVYAGLDPMAVEMAGDDGKSDASSATRLALVSGSSPAVWFVGLRQGSFRFAIDEHELASMERADLVAATARAVTQAYRAHHQLYSPDASTSERLVDLTSIFLGFGLLTTDASAPKPGQAKQKTIRQGVLMPQAMAFALASQLRLREDDPAAVKELLGHLRPNQAAYTRRALRWLDHHASDLSSRLGIPARETWTEPADLSARLAQLGEDLVTDDSASHPEMLAKNPPRPNPEAVEGMNRGRPVFMVDRNMSMRLARLFGLPPLLLGLVASRTLVAIEVDMGWVVLIAVAFAITGLIAGRFFRDRRCSEPRCGTRLDPSMTTCPRCGGRISGSIGHPKERLHAEEMLAKADDDGPPPVAT